jgi:hypothetical protein
MTVTGAVAGFEDRATESGAPLTREFCARCGSPIRSVPSASPKVVAVKAGALDDPGRHAPQMHIWTRSALPWVVMPEGVPRFEKDPS